MNRTQSHTLAAYGGEGWQPRLDSLANELGGIWGAGGMKSEWMRLRAVLLHRPGAELAASADPNAVQMLEPLDLARAQQQHDQIAATYRSLGVTVHYLEPTHTPSPNQMFMADLFFMTPEGAILARPASRVRAGRSASSGAPWPRWAFPLCAASAAAAPLRAPTPCGWTAKRSFWAAVCAPMMKARPKSPPCLTKWAWRSFKWICPLAPCT
ncbi:MAG: hypothetical protein R2911_40725 [Caldilineaceae bacterium]